MIRSRELRELVRQFELIAEERMRLVSTRPSVVPTLCREQEDDDHVSAGAHR